MRLAGDGTDQAPARPAFDGSRAALRSIDALGGSAG